MVHLIKCGWEAEVHSLHACCFEIKQPRSAGSLRADVPVPCFEEIGVCNSNVLELMKERGEHAVKT